MITWFLINILGSPFTVEIANPTVVKVSGDGITAVKVGCKTFFLVDTGQEGTMRDVVAKITCTLVLLLQVFGLVISMCMYYFKIQGERNWKCVIHWHTEDSHNKWSAKHYCMLHINYGWCFSAFLLIYNLRFCIFIFIYGSSLTACFELLVIIIIRAW